MPSAAARAQLPKFFLMVNSGGRFPETFSTVSATVTYATGEVKNVPHSGGAFSAGRAATGKFPATFMPVLSSVDSAFKHTTSADVTSEMGERNEERKSVAGKK